MKKILAIALVLTGLIPAAYSLTHTINSPLCLSSHFQNRPVIVDPYRSLSNPAILEPYTVDLAPVTRRLTEYRIAYGVLQVAHAAFFIAIGR